MKTVEICLVNLGNTGQFKYYNVSELEDLKTAYQDMANIFNADDIEIQGMSHSNNVVENLRDLLETAENNQASLKDVIQVFESGGCKMTMQCNLSEYELKIDILVTELKKLEPYSYKWECAYSKLYEMLYP